MNVHVLLQRWRRCNGPALLLLAVAVFGGVVPATAQERKWEVEVHGGGMLAANNPTGGAATLPDPGAPFTTGLGAASRRVSSWYFGDGALLLNQAMVQLPWSASQRFTPVDRVLSSSMAQRQRGGSFGFRVSRDFTPRFAAEFGFDFSLGPLAIANAGLAGIEASRSSFESSFRALIGGAPCCPNPTVTSTSAAHSAEGWQTFSTGAVRVNLKTIGKVIPYVTAGAGVISNGGDIPSVTLIGNYDFKVNVQGVNGSIPISETDTLSVRQWIDHSALVGLIGGGVKVNVAPRWGYRFDVRAHVSGNSMKTVVDANPSVATLNPPIVLIFGFGTPIMQSPIIQFVNNPSTGRQSSLSGPALTGFQVFRGSGVQSQVNLAAGVFWRF